MLSKSSRQEKYSTIHKCACKYKKMQQKSHNIIQAGLVAHGVPCSRPCSLEEQYFKCGFFWDYDTAQRHASNSEAPVLAGGVSVFLRGSQFSGASELKEGLVFKCKFI